MLPFQTTLSTSEGSSLSERVGLNLGGGISTSVVMRGVITTSLDLAGWDFDFLVSWDPGLLLSSDTYFVAFYR